MADFSGVLYSHNCLIFFVVLGGPGCIEYHWFCFFTSAISLQLTSGFCPTDVDQCSAQAGVRCLWEMFIVLKAVWVFLEQGSFQWKWKFLAYNLLQVVLRK